MDKKTIRRKFVNLTGREDLIYSDGRDDGADFFLAAGQKFIDRQFGGPDADGTIMARAFKELAAGEIGGVFTHCRAIKHVWIADATARTELEKKDFDWLQDSYAKPVDELTQGCPLYWSPIIMRTHPPPEHLTLAELDVIMGYAEFILGSQHMYHGVMVMPPCDAAYMLEVQGLFYTYDFNLMDEDEENFWTYNHPDLFLQAGIYRMESFMRNSEGMKDALGDLKVQLAGIDMDFVEQQMVDKGQMGG